MAQGPFSPWRQGDELTAADQIALGGRPASKLDGLGWRADAELYRALRHQLSPAQVDELELWQIGVLLGADLDHPEDDYQLTDADLERQRKFAQGPPPSDEPEDLTASVMAAMGIKTE